MKKATSRFTMPDRAPKAVDEWVSGHGASTDTATAMRAVEKGRMARLTIDLPADLHRRFKAACALKETRMIDEVRRFIQDWTQKHG